MKKQAKKETKLRFIVMTPGYVESACTAYLIYECAFFGHPGYTSYKEAITNLALDLYAKYYDDHLSVYENRYNGDVKDCCRKSLIADKTAMFCAVCGHRLADKKFDYEGFKDYVYNLTNTNCDTYGEAEGTATRQMTWWPWASGDFIGTPREEVIYIAEMAEQVLLAALLEAKPELVDPEDMTDFSYCEWEKFKNEKQPEYR